MTAAARFVQLCFVLLVFTACSDETPSNDEASSQTSASEQAQSSEQSPTLGEMPLQQTLKIGQLNAFGTHDPHFVVTDSDGHFVRQIFEGLFNLNALGQPVAGAAERYTVSDDGLTYRFYLRDNARWSNGEKLTADDFVRSWQRLLSPANQSPNAWRAIEAGIKNAVEVNAQTLPIEQLGVQVIDEGVFEVTLNEPRVSLPFMLSHPAFFPLNTSALQTHGDDWMLPVNIVTNGAYVFSDNVSNDTVRLLEKNAQYWASDSVSVSSVTFEVFNELSQAVAAFEDEQLDWLPVNDSHIDAFQAATNSVLRKEPGLCSDVWLFDFEKINQQALQAINSRRALVESVDLSTLNLGEGALPAYQLTPLSVVGATGLNPYWFEGDVSQRIEQARKRLAALDYTETNPLAFELSYHNNEANSEVVKGFADQWSQTLGVNIALNPVEWADYGDFLNDDHFDMAHVRWCADSTAPDSLLSLMASSSAFNVGRYENAEFKQTLKMLKNTRNAFAEFEQAEQQLFDDLAILPISHSVRLSARRDALMNWPERNAAGYWYAKDLFITPN